MNKRWIFEKEIPKNRMKISQTEIAPFETMKYEQPKIVNVWPSSIIGDEASREMSFKIERGKTFWDALRQYLSGRTWNLSQLQQHFLFTLISTYFEDNLYHTLPTVSFSCADIMYWGSSGSLVSFDWSGILLLKK